jgi:hypothetical protein
MLSVPWKKNTILTEVIKRHKYAELFHHSDFQTTDRQAENMAFVPSATLLIQCVSLLV